MHQLDPKRYDKVPNKFLIEATFPIEKEQILNEQFN